MDMTDKQAIADICEGGQKGFAILHRCYEGRLKKYLISRYNVDKSISEEICNGTFFKFYKTINQFREESSVFTWLIKLASHEISDYFAKIRRALPPSDNKIKYDIKFEPEIEKDLCYERCMRNVIAKIKNSSYANCIKVLIFFTQEQSIKEIAIKINRTPNATAVFMTSCRQKLQKNRDIKRCWEDC